MGAFKAGDHDKVFFMGTTNRATTFDTLSMGFDGATDAVSAATDTGLAVKRAFRFASPYAETMLDMDIFNDSLVSFAYTAQVEPTLKDNKSNRAISSMMEVGGDVLASDYSEDAFVGSLVLKTNVVLPVKLLTFDARRNENVVSVSWKVQSDETGQFILQRAVNGLAFINIELKNSLVNSSAVVYNTFDKLKDYGQYAYRLQLVSIDGKITYSNVVSIVYIARKASFYYDISGQQLHIVRSVNSMYHYKILDASGKVIATGQKTNGNEVISLLNQPKGLYIIQIEEQEDGTMQSFKFIK